MEKIKKLRDNRKRIIASSVKLFNKYGFENVTVNKIIEDSETSKGTFYYYFKAKDDLLVYILDMHDDKIKRYMRTLPDEIGPLKKIKALIQCIFTLYQEDNNAISIYNAKQIYHTQLVSNDKFLLKEDRYIYILLLELSAAAIKSGEIKATIDAKEVASSILLLLRGMFFNWYLSETQFNIKEKGCYIIDLYLADIQNEKPDRTIIQNK